MLVRGVAVSLVVLGVPVATAADISVVAFFVFVTALPMWIGYATLKDLNSRIKASGAHRPTLLLWTVRRINLVISIGFLIVIGLYLLNQSPDAKSNFNLLGNSFLQLLVTTSFILSWTLIFELFPLITLSSVRPNYLPLARLSIVSEIEEGPSPFLDWSIAYFNRFLRLTGWRIQISGDIKLSLVYLDNPILRRAEVTRLLNAIDGTTPLSFVRAVAEVVHKNPDEIMKKSFPRPSSADLIQVSLAVAAVILALIQTLVALHGGSL